MVRACVRQFCNKIFETRRDELMSPGETRGGGSRAWLGTHSGIRCVASGSAGERNNRSKPAAHLANQEHQRGNRSVCGRQLCDSSSGGNGGGTVRRFEHADPADHTRPLGQRRAAVRPEWCPSCPAVVPSLTFSQPLALGTHTCPSSLAQLMGQGGGSRWIYLHRSPRRACRLQWS